VIKWYQKSNSFVKYDEVLSTENTAYICLSCLKEVDLITYIGFCTICSEVRNTYSWREETNINYISFFEHFMFDKAKENCIKKE
jgi:hypothetical protein